MQFQKKKTSNTSLHFYLSKQEEWPNNLNEFKTSERMSALCGYFKSEPHLEEEKKTVVKTKQ